MSEAADTFDAEFESARDAEREDAPDVNDELGDEGAEGEGESEGEELPPEKTPAELRAEAAEKRLQDTQKAMKAERRKRQELEKRFEALERKAGEDPRGTPDPAALAALLREDDEDPIGDIQTVKKLAKLLVSQTAEESAADRQAQERARVLNTVATTMKEYEDDFKDLHPDYGDAAKHFMDARAEELKDTGLDGAALRAAMENDFAGIVTRSVAASKDPAEIIYNMAVRRGYKAGTESPAATKLATIAKGQEQAKTLPGGSSGTGSALSYAKVSELKGAAFDAAFEKLRAQEKRR